MKTVIVTAILVLALTTTVLAGGYCTTNRTTPMFPSLREVIMVDKVMKAGGPRAGLLVVIELVKKGRADIYPAGVRCKQVVDINQHLAVVKLPNSSIRFVGKVFLDCPKLEGER